MLTKNTEFTPDSDVEDQPAATVRRPYVFSVFRVVAQTILMLVILAGGLFAMQQIIAAKPETPRRPAFPTVYTVDMVRAEPGAFQPQFTVYGEMLAARTVDLRSLVGGEVTSVSPNLRPGAFVEKGEPLVEIDRFDYEGALREAKATLAENEARLIESRSTITLEESRLSAAREQLALSDVDLQRITDLRAKGAATEKALEDRKMVISQRQAAVDQSTIAVATQKARLAQQESVIERLRWKVEQAERNLANTVLTAPFSGVVRSATVEAGRMVSGNDVAVSLYEKGNLEVRFTLSDERYARISSDGETLIGRPLEIVWAAGGVERTVTGKVVRLGADITANRGGVEVYASVGDDAVAGLRPGAFVEVRVPDRRFENHFRLPETSVYDGNTVYAVIDGRLQARPVTVSAYENGHVLVSGGIAPGEEILVTRISEIGEGLRVAKPGEEPVQGKQGEGRRKPVEGAGKPANASANTSQGG